MSTLTNDGNGNFFAGNFANGYALSGFYGAGGTLDTLLGNAGIPRGWSTNSLFWRPSSSAGETLTGTVSGSSVLSNAGTNNRFGLRLAGGGSPSISIRTDGSNHVSQNNILGAGGNFTGHTGALIWATCTADALAIFSFISPTDYRFLYQGIVQGSSAFGFIPGLCYFETSNSVAAAGFRPNATTGTASRALDLADGNAYEITCTNGATDSPPWCANLFLREDNASTGDAGVGFAQNLLLAKGSWTVGDRYNIRASDSSGNATNDPVLGSLNRIYICCGRIYGASASAGDYILMRIGE